MSLQKVLIVEDDSFFMRIMAERLSGKAEVLQATTLGVGEQIFDQNPDLALILMDACVPGDRPNSMPLVQKIRRSFTGPIIATSSDPRFRKILLQAGCNHEADKQMAGLLAIELLQSV